MPPPARYDVLLYSPSIGPLIRPGDGPSPGGAETQLYLLAQTLAGAGVKVGVVCLGTRNGLPARADGFDVLIRPPRPDGSRRFARPRELSLLWRFFRTVDSPVVVQRAAGYDTGIVGLISRLQRRRFVYSTASTGDFSRVPWRIARDQALFSLGVRLATTIVVQTPQQVEMCRSAFGRSPVLIRSLAEPTSACGGPPEAFLWVGRTDDVKDPLAYVELARRVPEALFRMLTVPTLGQERLQADLERVAHDVTNLELLAPRPRSDALAIYDRGIAVVNTSHHEGMPNAFLEGWARGLPALSLRVDPGKALTREGLGRCADGSLERLADHARDLWAHRTDLGGLAARCRAYIEREHGQDAVTRWLDVIGVGVPERDIQPA
jgi:glycosyl transferase family 4/glycosyl transferase family 1